MQKKCKKMQIYLHIWNIFCTFASDLGIVPAVTNRYHRVMKKVCVFRVSGGRDWYRIYRYFVLGVGTVYDVYCNRRHIAGQWRFTDFDKAVGTAVAMAKINVYFITDGEDVQ